MSTWLQLLKEVMHPLPWQRPPFWMVVWNNPNIWPWQLEAITQNTNFHTPNWLSHPSNQQLRTTHSLPQWVVTLSSICRKWTNRRQARIILPHSTANKSRLPCRSLSHLNPTKSIREQLICTTKTWNYPQQRHRISTHWCQWIRPTMIFTLETLGLIQPCTIQMLGIPNP